MRNGENYRLKLLYMMQMFMEKTDKEHYMTMPEILEYLSGCGVICERKSIYADVAELRKFGLDIVMKKQGGAAYYYLEKRDFDIAELKLLVDSVQSAKFITEKKIKGADKEARKAHQSVAGKDFAKTGLYTWACQDHK